MPSCPTRSGASRWGTPIIVSARWLRDAFNRDGYWQRAVAGEFRCCRKPDSTPASTDEPASAVSVLVICSDDDGVRVMFHAYVRVLPDGHEIVGGSGRPDPKWLRMGERVYRPERDQHQ